MHIHSLATSLCCSTQDETRPNNISMLKVFFLWCSMIIIFFHFVAGDGGGNSATVASFVTWVPTFMRDYRKQNWRIINIYINETWKNTERWENDKVALTLSHVAKSARWVAYRSRKRWQNFKDIFVKNLKTNVGKKVIDRTNTFFFKKKFKISNLGDDGRRRPIAWRLTPTRLRHKRGSERVREIISSQRFDLIESLREWWLRARRERWLASAVVTDEPNKSWIKSYLVVIDVLRIVKFHTCLRAT